MTSPERGCPKDRKIIRTIRESKKSESDIYHMIWINSAVTGVKVSPGTCRSLLGNMRPWRELPLRIRAKIGDDIVGFMCADCLPTQKDVENKIQSHEIVVRYLAGTMPPESEHQRTQEQEERQRRDSDIEKLRLRTMNEIRYVTNRVNRECGVFDDLEDPTLPDIKPLSPVQFTESFYQSYLGFEEDDEENK